MTSTVLGKRKSAPDLRMRGDEKEADLEVQEEVDTWILDYLIYQATKALLGERRAERQGDVLSESARPDQPLLMVDSFTTHFRASHPHRDTLVVLKSRLRLLQFVCLFARRLRPTSSSPTLESLQYLRHRIDARLLERELDDPPDFDEHCEQWRAFPLSEKRLARNQQQFLRTLKVEQGTESGYFGSPSAITMFDLLPQFMSLSAYVFQETGFEVKELWMELAAEFMLQAALEQYLVHGLGGAETLRMCFSYGWDSNADKDRRAKYWQANPSLTDEDCREMAEDEDVNNDMFHDEEDDTEIKGWKEIRERFMNFLKPEQDMNLIRQMELAAAQHSVFDFEGQVISFLEAILSSSPAPFLVQLEANKIDGMTTEETAELKARVGLPL